MNRLRAAIRWLSPRSSSSHSAARKNPRHDVEGDDAFGPLAVAVDVERDAHAEHGAVGRPLPALEIVGRETLQVREEDLALAAGATGRLEQLVVEVAHLVGGEGPRQSRRDRVRDAISGAAGPTTALLAREIASAGLFIVAELGETESAIFARSLSVKRPAGES